VGKSKPYYQQIRDDIKKKIQEGYYAKGTYLPCEKSLEQEYQVSRTTIRSAVNELVLDGYLYIVRGKGTKVACSRLMDNNPNLLSFTEILKSHGYESQILERSFEIIKADEKTAKKMSMEEGEELIRIYRVRGADGEPVSINDSYFPAKLFRGRNPRLLFEGDSLYECLEKYYHIEIKEVKEEIWAVAAKGRNMQILNVEKHAPLLAFERESFGRDGSLIEYSKVVYRSDRYRHAVVMRRER